MKACRASGAARLSPVYTVDQFHNGDHGHAYFQFAMNGFNLLKDLPNRMPSPLSRDQHTGV